MRKTKFRFWDTNKQCFIKTVFTGRKRFIQEPYVNAFGNVLVRTFSSVENHGNDIIAIQSTGQKDKNKEHEIFLGDIVKREFDIWKTEYAYDGSPMGDECIEEGYFIGVVSQTPSGLYVMNKAKKYNAEGKFIKKCSGVKLFAHRCEVIGNIYENPELLEATQ